MSESTPWAADPVAPTIEPIFRVVLRTSDPVLLGDTPGGTQSVAPVAGGILSGPGIEALVRPIGADVRVVRADGSSTYELDLIAQIDETDPDGDADGGSIRLRLSGFRFASAEVTAALDNGEDVDPSIYYFRGTAVVSTSVRSFAYLNRAVLVTSGAQKAGELVFDAFLVT